MIFCVIELRDGRIHFDGHPCRLPFWRLMFCSDGVFFDVVAVLN